MNILHCVEQYPPDTGGMAEVVRRLSEGLVRLGHQVTVLTTSRSGVQEHSLQQGVRVVRFAVGGNWARGMHGDTESALHFVRQEAWDVLTLFAAQQWSADLLLPHLAELPGRKVFVPTGFSGLYQKEYQSYFQQMRQWILGFDRVVFLSREYRDFHFAQQCGVRHAVVIPNGAAAEEFSTPVAIDMRAHFGIPTHYRLLLLVGSHTGLKGHDEAMQILERCASQDVALLVVGNHYTLRYHKQRSHFWGVLRALQIHDGCCPFSCQDGVARKNQRMAKQGQRKRILMASLSREMTVAAYQQANLFLFPSNIECSPIVLFESMAARTPFLTTDVGNSREIVETTGAGELLPTRIDRRGYSHAHIAQSARMLDSLLNDPARLLSLAEHGYRSWQERYTWEKITQCYEQEYKLSLQGGTP